MKKYVVRIVEPSSKPALPKAGPVQKLKSSGKKHLNIVIGSLIGLAAGVCSYLILKAFGICLGSLESSVIVGLPALIGLITSFAIF